MIKSHYTIAGSAVLLALFLGVILALLPVSAHAQGSLTGSSRSSEHGSRPKSTQISFMELIESGGEAFTGLFQQVSSATVDEPEWDGTESPRSTVMTFLEAMNHVAQGRDKAWSRAERTMADFDGDRQKAAMDLLAIFDRLPVVSPGSVPGSQTVREQKISRYELFPRGIDSGFVYRVLDDAPRGSILLTKSDQGWQFDATTLAGASELLSSLRKIPPRARLERKGDLFLNTVQPTFTRTPWMGWVQLIGILVVTLVAY